MTETSTTTPATFAVGSVYGTGHGDYTWMFEVVARTARFVTLRDSVSELHRVKVHIDARDGGEWALPLGSYSMAPVIRADRPLVAS